MTSPETAKAEIRALLEKYNKLAAEQKLERYNEEMTKKDFILPLFRALGWDVENSGEVTAEEKIGKTRVDYGFRINGIPKFFLEAKALKEDLDNPQFVEQAINYSWHKGCTWAVLTDFESVKIYNAEWKTASPMQSHLKTVPCYEFQDRFQELWLLSKESFEQGLLDKEAEKWGKKTKKSPVDRQLLADFTRFRELLSKNITSLNQGKNVTEEDLDEAVQRILDRLIFIRNCEDRELEAKTLLPNLREWESRGKGQMIKSLREVFAHFDREYNSKIFASHLCDDLDLDNEVLHEIIEGLYYTRDKSISYDFSAIEADVLGNIYEQYLGHILKKTEKRAKLSEAHAHRKEQGIYYTPTYIVDYIVRNTLGEVLKHKAPKEIEKLRILDPACGSGSFLIKAFDVLNEHYAKNDKDYGQTRLDSTGQGATYTRKLRILKDNIFGVDLDKQAVEIAQLNLLLKIAERKHRLPLLQENIKCGNSLIDDEKIAGDRAFAWERQFPEIMKGGASDGGFDVIIGNPPYVRIQTLNKDEVEYYNKKYESPTKNYDIYILFIEKGFKLLKEDGVLGLILPHKFFQGEMGENIRRHIYETKSLYKIVDFTTNQIFESAATYTCLLFLTKRKNKQFLYKRFNLGDNFKNLLNTEFEKKDSEVLKESKWNFSDDKVQKILSKIFSQKNSFPSITKKIFKGSSTGDDEIFLLDPIEEGKDSFTVFSKKLNQTIKMEKAILRPFVYGEDIRRFAPLKSKKLLLFPYVLRGDELQLIPVEEMKKRYPLAYAYLNRLKDGLTKRKIETDSNNFYKYSAARSLKEYTQPKIMVPDMLVSNRISYDEKGVVYHGPAIHSIVFNEKIKGQNPILYLAILNSKLFWFFISNTSTALRGDAYRLTPEFLNPFCFPEFDLSKNHEKQIYDALISLAEKMLALNKRLAEIGDKKTDERARIEDEIKKTDSEIDTLVYRLYCITEAEKKVIEVSIAKT